MNILAISGSVRAQSSNSDILKAIAALLPENINYTIYKDLEALPHFNPDTNGDLSPAIVNDFRAQLKDADAVIICTPEYAFNLPGVLKDALDWIVSSGEFTDKPTAVISASPLATGGEKAMASLLQTLRVMGAKIPDEITMKVPFVKKKFNEHGAITDDASRDELTALLENLAAMVAASPGKDTI